MEFHALVCPPSDNVHTFVHAVYEGPSKKPSSTKVQHVSSSGAGSVFCFDRVSGYSGEGDHDQDEYREREGKKEMDNAARGALDGLLAAVVSGSSVAVIIGGEADDVIVKQKLVRQVVLTAAKELFAMREEALESFPEDGPAFSLRLSCFAVDADVAMSNSEEAVSGTKETVLDALAAAAGVGAALNPGSGPFSPGGRYGPSTTTQSNGNSSSSSSSALAGSILLSPKRASDGDSIPFGSSSFVQQQQQRQQQQQHKEVPNSGVYSAAALMATAPGHSFSEHASYGSLHVPSLWEVECEDQDDVVDVCEAIDETLSSPAFSMALARQSNNRTSRDSSSSSMSYHSCVQLTLHRKDDKQASKLSVLRLARASAQVSQSSRSSSTPRGKGNVINNNNGNSSVPAWVVSLCDVLSAVEQRSPRVPFSSSRATLMLRDSLTGRMPSVFLVPVPNLDALGLATLRIASRIQSASKTLAQVVGQTVNSNTNAVTTTQSKRRDDVDVDDEDIDNDVNDHQLKSSLRDSSHSAAPSRKTALETADLLLREIDQQREHDLHVNRALNRSNLLSTSLPSSSSSSFAAASSSSSLTSNARSVSFADNIEKKNIRSYENQDEESSSDGLLDDDEDDENDIGNRVVVKNERIPDRSFPPPPPSQAAPSRRESLPVMMIKSPTAVSVSIIKGATAASSVVATNMNPIPNNSTSRHLNENTSSVIPLASPTGRTGLDLEYMGSRLAATSKELFSATVEALDRSKVQVAHLAEQVEQMRQQRDKGDATSNNALSMSQLSFPPPPPPPRVTAAITTATAPQRLTSSSSSSSISTPMLDTTTTSFSGSRPKQTATSLARASMAAAKSKKGKVTTGKGATKSGAYFDTNGSSFNGKSSISSTFTYDADDNGNKDYRNSEDDGDELDEALTENNNINNDDSKSGGGGFGYSTINNSRRSLPQQTQQKKHQQQQNDEEGAFSTETRNYTSAVMTPNVELQQAVQKLQAEFIILRGERDRLLVESKAMQKITRDYSLYREVIQGAMTRLQTDTERLVIERDAAAASLRAEKTAHAKEKIAHTACKRRIAELEYIVSAFDATQKTKEEAAHALGQLRVAIREAAAVHTSTSTGSFSSSKKHQQHNQSGSRYSDEEVLNLRHEYEALVKRANSAEERANALENELSASHVSMAQLLMATATGNGNLNSSSTSTLDTSVVATAATSLSAATAAATRSPSPSNQHHQNRTPLPPTVPVSSQKLSQPRRNSFSEGQQRQKTPSSSSSSSSSLGSIHASSPSSSSSSYLHALQHRASAVGLGVKNAAGSSRSMSSTMLSVDDAMTLNNQQQQRPPRPSMGPSMGMASSTQKIPPSAKFELASGRVNGMLNRGPLVGSSRVSFGNQAKTFTNSSSSSSSSTPRRLIGGSGYGQTPQRMQRQQQQQQQQQYQGINSLDPTSAELLETVNSLASEVSAAVGSLYSGGIEE